MVQIISILFRQNSMVKNVHDLGIYLLRLYLYCLLYFADNSSSRHFPWIFMGLGFISTFRICLNVRQHIACINVWTALYTCVSSKESKNWGDNRCLLVGSTKWKLLICRSFQLVFLLNHTLLQNRILQWHCATVSNVILRQRRASMRYFSHRMSHVPLLVSRSPFLYRQQAFRI